MSDSKMAERLINSAKSSLEVAKKECTGQSTHELLTSILEMLDIAIDIEIYARGEEKP